MSLKQRLMTAVLMAVALDCAPALCQSLQITPAPQRTRVIDVEEAREEKKEEHSFKIHHVPLLPLSMVGSGMRSGLITLEEKHLLEKAQYYLSEREKGFTLLFGGLGIGSGLTFGGKYYNNNFIKPGGRFEIPVRVSTLLYQEYGVAMSLPFTDARRTFFDAQTFYRVRTQDDFFGIGNESTLGGRTSYLTRSLEFLAGPRWQFTPRAGLTTRFGYRTTDVEDGKDKAEPVISALHSPANVPGLADGAALWIGSADLEHDNRDVPGRPRRGGYHHVGAGWFGSADEQDFGFWRYRVEAQRFLPLWSRGRTLALRFLGVTNQPRGGSKVPFFEQFILGGSRSMRGYREFRFYDQSGLLMTAEYRFNLNAWMDLVLFTDWGQVARQPGDFSWDGLRGAWGGGVRFLSSTSTPFKVMIGRSREGTRIYFSMGPTF